MVNLEDLPKNENSAGTNWHDLVMDIKKETENHMYRDIMLRHIIELENLFVNRYNDFGDVTPFLTREKVFGYTWEDVNNTIKSIVEKGDDCLSAMGIDSPLAVLSGKDQLLYNYFKQLFAQVTNPPIDALREKIVTSTNTMLGG